MSYGEFIDQMLSDAEQAGYDEAQKMRRKILEDAKEYAEEQDTARILTEQAAKQARAMRANST